MIPTGETLGGATDTTIDDSDTTSDTEDDDQNIVPTGALNPTSYEVEDEDGDGEGELQETTLHDNTIADVADDVDYSDTSVDEAEMTSDDPQTTEEVIEEHSSQEAGDQPDNTPADDVEERVEERLDQLANELPGDLDGRAVGAGLAVLGLAVVAGGE